MSVRSKRVAHLVHERLAKLLLEEISDPALKDLVITEVDLSPDLKNAKIFYQPSAFAEFEKTAVSKGFKRAEPYLRRQLGKDAKLRYVPSLNFEEDTHWERVNRVVQLIEEQSE